MTEAIFVMDTSTSMTYGTRWSNEPDPADFVYEPWHSALLMLDEVSRRVGDIRIIAGAGGPGGVVKSLKIPEEREKLTFMGPGGWRDIRTLFDVSGDWVIKAQQPKIFVVDRGPTDESEQALYKRFALDATRMGTHSYWVPMGNDVDHDVPFRGYPASPFLMVMDFIYYPHHFDEHEFDMLPGIVASEIVAKIKGQ